MIQRERLIGPLERSGWLALDVRSFALFRIFLGSVLIVDIVTRCFALQAHYTAQGLLPLSDYLYQPDLSYRLWSVFFVSDSPIIVGALFLLFFVAAVAFTVGWNSRLTCWLCWLLLVSVQHRNPMIINAGDHYLALLFFWGGFLPLGDAYSVERPGGGNSSRSGFSVAGFCLLLQVCYVYWFSSVLRYGVEWVVEGSALYFALHSESLRTAFGAWMLSRGETVLNFFSRASLALETFGPVLLLLPSWRLRTLAVFLVISFHFGILLSLSIGIFTLVGMTAPLSLLPSEFWSTRPGRLIDRFLESQFNRLAERLPNRLIRPFLWSPGPLFRRLATEVVPLLALSLTTFHLVHGIHFPDEKYFLTDTARVLSLDQRWGVYSPSPSRDSSWTRAPARTEKGNEVDLLTGQPYREDVRPTENPRTMLETRWSVYNMRLTISFNNQHPSLYLRYLVKEWNQKHPDDQVLAARFVIDITYASPDFRLGTSKQAVLAEYFR